MDESYKLKYAENVYDELSEIPKNIAEEIMKGIKNLCAFPFIRKIIKIKKLPANIQNSIWEYIDFILEKNKDKLESK